MAFPILPAELRRKIRTIRQQIDKAETSVRSPTLDESKVACLALQNAADAFLAIREAAMEALVLINLNLLAREKKGRAS
jgi:hypothetical protein